MKKSVRLTFLTQQILMGIVFAVSLIGIFLNEDHSVKSDYMFNCAQSGMFLIVSLTPSVMKKLKLDIPGFIYILFIFFCLAHFLCGEILGFFVKVSWWDSALHTFSGMLIALLSFSLVNLLNKSNGADFKLSIGFASLFAFCFTIAVGVVWEILEFSFDSILGWNMQRAYISTMSGRGEALRGTEALLDTMKDLILDAIGAVVVCVTCAFFVKKKGVKVEDLSFIKKSKKQVVPLRDDENSDEVISSLAEKNEIKENIEASDK